QEMRLLPVLKALVRLAYRRLSRDKGLEDERRAIRPCNRDGYLRRGGVFLYGSGFDADAYVVADLSQRAAGFLDPESCFCLWAWFSKSGISVPAAGDVQPPDGAGQGLAQPFRRRPH